MILEVKTGHIHTFDGERHDIHGGAWLSPEAFLASRAEVEQARQREAASAIPLVLGAALFGFAVGAAVGWWAANDD